ncbi:MAG TPA: hypothetical protein VH186_14110 [Chloroflexia bacterium]|nr:hypothetical protein [Chloroflexia bacterium]
MNFQPVIDSLSKIVSDILDFIPRFINGLIILIVGYLVCLLVRAIARFILRRVHLDQLAERSGVTGAIQGLGIKAPLSEIFVQIIFFFLILSFATAAVRLMGLDAVAELLENVLRFVPKAISAALLLIFGSMLARFLGNTIAAVAESINITYSSALGKVIEYAVIAFTAILAISTLGVDTTILTSSFTILIASAGLAIALTFGLGSREAARNVIAGYYVRQNFRPGQQLSVGSYNGTIRATSGAYTIIETTDETGNASTVSVPNALLLQEAIRGRENSAPLG